MPDALDPEQRAAEERLGRVLGGKWKLERLLGVGGMAAVYAATSSEGRAAVKVLHPEMSRRSDIRQRFAQEGTAARHVGHPGVVNVLESGEETDGTAYLVLELLEGESLSDFLRREDGLPLPRLLDFLDQVLDVLAAAHEKGIVHRDLKPDNLFVTAGGRIKVLDFGIARVLDDIPGAYKTRTGITLGTVPFMSPEQALGKRDQVDGRSDLFSLGAMTFRILTGRHVHDAETDAELLVAMASKPAPPIATVTKDLPQGICAIVDLSLAFSKDSRYPDARTMQTDVRAAREGKVPPHADRVRRARDMATRTDLPAPSIPVPVPSRAVTVPEATASTQPDQTLRDLPAALSRLREDPADTAPPSSLRAIAMPVMPDLAHDAAPTKVDPPPFGAPTIPMSASPERTLVSSPPPAPSGKRRLWIGLGAAALVLAGVAYAALGGPEAPSADATRTEAVPASSAEQPAPAAEPAAPTETTTRAVTPGPRAVTRPASARAGEKVSATAPGPAATATTATAPAAPGTAPAAAEPAAPAPSPAAPTGTQAALAPAPTSTATAPAPKTAPAPTSTAPAHGKGKSKHH